jgi:hypothetical protein
VFVARLHCDSASSCPAPLLLLLLLLHPTVVLTSCMLPHFTLMLPTLWQQLLLPPTLQGAAATAKIALQQHSVWTVRGASMQL